MHLPFTSRGRRTDREEGSVLIEVVVTAALLIIVALGVLKAMDAADARGAEQKAKAVAGNIAQAEQERLRSLSLDELSNLYAPSTITQNNATFDVVSRASWVTDSTGEANCETGGASADYLRITTTVTGKSLRGRKPVTLSSILSPPARSFAQNEGSLAVKVTDRDGVGVPGLSLSLTGLENVSGITNSQGCVLWGYLKADPNYTLKFSRPGWIDPAGVTNVSSTQAIVGEQTRSVVFMYDEGGSLRTNFVTKSLRATPAGALVASAPEQVTVEHPGPPSTVNSYAMTGSSIDTPALFPFNSDWAIYAGCQSSRPAAPKFKTVNPGPVTDAGQIELPAIDVLITNGTNTNGTPKLVNNASVHVRTPCGHEYDRNTNSTGRLADPGYPFGTGFQICAHNATRQVKLTGINNTSLAGQNLTIDLNSSSSSGGQCPTGW